MTPSFNISREYPRMHVWYKIWWYQSKPVKSYHVEKPNFLELWVKVAKMTLKVKVNYPYFRYQLRISHDACLVQIWWFQLKSVTSYRADKLKFTDRQTHRQMDRRADAGNDNTPSAWKARGQQ